MHPLSSVSHFSSLVLSSFMCKHLWLENNALACSWRPHTSNWAQRKPIIWTDFTIYFKDGQGTILEQTDFSSKKLPGLSSWIKSWRVTPIPSPWTLKHKEEEILVVEKKIPGCISVTLPPIPTCSWPGWHKLSPSLFLAHASTSRTIDVAFAISLGISFSKAFPHPGGDFFPLASLGLVHPSWSPGITEPLWHDLPTKADTPLLFQSLNDN